MTGPHIVVHKNAELLAQSCAARLVTRLVDIQTSRSSASLVLTGGGVGIAVLTALRQAPARDAVDWSRVDVYWGDDRFVPADDPQRNERQAREALLDHVALDPARIHAMAPSDGPFGDDPDAAAADYARVLADHADRDSRSGVPSFDIMLLGMGPDGHTASLFPESPSVYEDERTVIAVRNSPKPPPTRVSLTFPAIRHASEVWVLAAGAEKSDAVALALSGAGPTQIPVAGAVGQVRTRWLLDAAAANTLPARFLPPAG